MNFKTNKSDVVCRVNTDSFDLFSNIEYIGGENYSIILQYKDYYNRTIKVSIVGIEEECDYKKYREEFISSMMDSFISEIKRKITDNSILDYPSILYMSHKSIGIRELAEDINDGSHTTSYFIFGDWKEDGAFDYNPFLYFKLKFSHNWSDEDITKIIKSVKIDIVPHSES